MVSRVVLALALISACSKSNPNYCPDHPDDNCALDGGANGGDGAIACTDNGACPGQVCDLTLGVCAACTPDMADACMGTTPVCGADDTCHACRADADCASQACLPDGSCADASAVLHAAPGGSDTTATCTMAEPCSIEHAVSLVDATHDVIRAAPGMYSLKATLALTSAVTIVGRDATLEKSSGPHGAALTITGAGPYALDYVTVEGGDDLLTGFGIGCTNATLTLFEATVQGNLADGLNASGCTLDLEHGGVLDNGKVGITTSGGSLVVRRSTVSGNSAGGIATSGSSFDLESAMIVKNGSATSGFGGLLLSQLGSGAHVLAFDTIAHNVAGIGLASGVQCSAIASPLTFSNHIIFGNTTAQVTGANCTYTYSDIGPDPVTGTGNANADPAFAGPDDFHLTAGSPAIDAADPAASPSLDLDGDTRPQGTAADMGADEYTP